MRKMTKTAVTLAAMSAMTVACASLAFAAEKQEPNISSIAREEEAVNTSAVGEWSGDDVKGWSFTKEGNIKLKDQWAQIDGVWYYFLGDKIAQNRFLTLDDKGYFFDETGRLATGWQKITSKMDAYSDIDIADGLYDPTNNYYVQVDENHEYDYHDFVWCYFDESGVAKHNEWFQSPESGLWYYFDGDVMVKNVYNYEVNPDNYDAADSNKRQYYGFDEDGAMLVGWNYKEVPTTWNNPTADDKGQIWYYYKSNGQMQQTGWKQIEGKWYLFANEDADGTNYGDGVGSGKWLKGGYPLIVNSYVASHNKNKYEYFYVNKKGELVSGVQTVPKNSYKVVFYQEDKSVEVAYEQVKVSKDIDVNFGEKNYAAKEAVVNGRFYTMGTDNTVLAKFGNSTNNNVWKVNNSLYNAEYAFTGWTPTNGEWSFTDNGDATPSTVAVSSYYVDKTDFSFVSAEDVEDGTVKKSTVVALPNIEEAEEAVAVAVLAYQDKVTANSNYVTASNAWINAVENVTLAVSGYEGTDATTYGELLTKKNEAKSTCDVRELAYNEARRLGASDAVIAEAKANYLAAKAEYDSYNTLCKKAEVDAQVAAIIADNATTYNAYKNAETEKEKCDKAYTDARNKVLDLNYDNFINKWDSGSITTSTNFAVVGELVKNAFIARSDDTLYLADADGNFVTNKAVVINTDANLTLDNTTYNNAYILFGKDGKAICGYEGTRKSITVGGVTYWATDRRISIGKADDVTVFVSNKAVKTTANGEVQR